MHKIDIQKQLEIIPKIKKLCEQAKFDEAMTLSDKIVIPEISVEVRILIIKSEQNYLNS